MSIVKKIINKFLKIINLGGNKIITQLDLYALKKQIARVRQQGGLKIVIGSGGVTQQEGWVATDEDTLDLIKESDWKNLFEEGSIDAVLAEHVWDYLTDEQGLDAFKRCYRYLKQGGYVRLSLPDDYFPSEYYLNYVKQNKKSSYNYKKLLNVLEKIGFEVRLLEYFDEHGTFNQRPWDQRDGRIKRSKDHDDRNSEGKILYTSLIADAFKKQYAGGYTILKNPNLVQLKSNYSEAWKDTSIPHKQLELTKRELPNFMNVPTMKSLVELMRKIEPDGQSVLEIGCSTGYYSEVLKKSGFDIEYEGCDYSPDFIKLAQERYPAIKFKISDATKLDYQDAQFDISISGSCISHIVDYEKAIAEAVRIAKKFVIFHRTPMIHKHETIFTERSAYGIAMLGILFNEEALMNLFKKYGLAVKTTSVLTTFYIEDLNEPISIKSYLCEKI